MNKEKFIEIYKQIESLSDRNDKIDKIFNEIMDSDFCNNIAGSLSGKYEVLCLKILSYAFKEQELAYDWITYCFYESKDFEQNVEIGGIKYTVNNAETLADFLFKEYELKQ